MNLEWEPRLAVGCGDGRSSWWVGMVCNRGTIGCLGVGAPRRASLIAFTTDYYTVNFKSPFCNFSPHPRLKRFIRFLVMTPIFHALPEPFHRNRARIARRQSITWFRSSPRYKRPQGLARHYQKVVKPRHLSPSSLTLYQTHGRTTLPIKLALFKCI